MNLKIISYNIHKGFDTFGFRFALHQIKEALISTQADILFLQEVVGENHKHKKNISNWPTESQFEFLADSVWPHHSYGKNAIYPERHHGNAILSRYPITFSENINLSTNPREQRGLLHCVVQIPEINKNLHLFNVHLDLFAKGRKIQLQKIVERAQKHVPEHESFVLAGDFNDWSQELSPHFYDYLGVFEAHHKIHGQHAPSFPSFFPFLRLDRVYCRHIEVHHTETLTSDPWSKISDHVPIMVNLKIK
jgi:endonuclease/exonuclease/phosphatase family metal-dependent hydrolase